MTWRGDPPAHRSRRRPARSENSRTEAWLTYLCIDWRTAGIDPNPYWQDLCELLVWEPYAVDHGNETAWFSSARRSDVDMIEAILLALEAEHRRVVLDYEADAALEALADLYLATKTHVMSPRMPTTNTAPTTSVRCRNERVSCSGASV